MSILEKMGIFGWKEEEENLLLASILTGDPLLLIGRHGSAKTAVAEKMAEALARKFIVYDASKALFEDVLGYPNIRGNPRRARWSISPAMSPSGIRSSSSLMR